MGSYSECWLGSFLFGMEKNDFSSSIISLFRAEDKQIVGQQSAGLPPVLEKYRESTLEYPDEEANLVYYQAPSSVIKDRLEVTGYTLANAKDALVSV